MAGQSYETIVQAQTIADTPGAWIQSVDFAQFDPSLGTLLNVNTGLTTILAGTVSIENLEAAPASFGIGLGASIQVVNPAAEPVGYYTSDGGTPPWDLVSASADTWNTATLAAYDGTLDYAGPSGTILNGLSAAATQNAVLQAGTTGTTGFVGTGTATLAVTGSSWLEIAGPANMQVLSHASAGAVVTLDYNYGAGGTAINGGYGGDEFTISQSYNPFLAVVVGSQTTTVQSFSFADATTGWTNTVAAQQFDPSLGILEAVNITLSSDILASIEGENLDPTPAAITASQAATVSLDYPGSASPILSTSASVNSGSGLSAYDGTTDFAGSSGFVLQGLTAESVTDYAVVASGLMTAGDAGFVGTGTVDLPVVSSSAATLNGPGNLLAQILAESGASVTVSYTYQPIPVASGAGSTVSDTPGRLAIAGPAISLSDAATSLLTGATVAITGGILAGDELMTPVVNRGAIAAYYDTGTGVLTLSGTATLADYQQALRSVAFDSNAADPTAGDTDPSRTLTWTVTDEYGAASMPVTTTIDVQPAGPPPDVAHVDVLPFASLMTDPIMQVVTAAPLDVTQRVFTPLDPIVPVALTPVTVSDGTAKTFLPMLPISPGIAPTDAVAAIAIYPGAVPAASLGLDPLQLADISGAGPAAPDVWLNLTQTDICNAGSVLGILLNPADQRWVALSTPQGAALSAGTIVAGGPVAALGQFLSQEHQGL